ncbi:chymotrypsin-like elastase family member 2A [Penaeus monodon]|uniref:chymotrypsin-like elastase family member 2A n=1 Tax=Penaeus monodon TaxID=6687 RepID=UPI0018A7098C|nr:chymotrypsin-like elastase family member 2A [Penaeus monodon]
MSKSDNWAVAENLDATEGNDQAVALSKIIQHEDYNGFTISNDISLLKLSQPLTFNDYVGPIALPEAGHATSGECIVSGWGALSEGGSSPSVLQKVSVPIVGKGLLSDYAILLAQQHSMNKINPLFGDPSGISINDKGFISLYLMACELMAKSTSRRCLGILYHWTTNCLPGDSQHCKKRKSDS